LLAFLIDSSIYDTTQCFRRSLLRRYILAPKVFELSTLLYRSASGLHSPFDLWLRLSFHSASAVGCHSSNIAWFLKLTMLKPHRLLLEPGKFLMSTKIQYATITSILRAASHDADNSDNYLSVFSVPFNIIGVKVSSRESCEIDQLLRHLRCLPLCVSMRLANGCLFL
jgi:hypothetical protein